MASQKTIDIVKATVPVLEQKGEEITTVFYRNMLNGEPELLDIFNNTNQMKGRQQRALAATVYAAAKYIDQLHVLESAVRQIGHKHRSLMVKPHHYPIVGQYLLEAIKEVLGDAATDDIISAWAEAYGEIADIFIAIEKELYEKTGEWSGFRDFTVVDKVKESSEITSFWLKPVEGSLPEFLPGQYVSVQISIPDEPHLINRQYSISNAARGEALRISVKRDSGEAGSPAGKSSVYLHDYVEIGSIIKVSAPAGEFTLLKEEKLPIHFIAGGIGITPFMGMMNELAKSDQDRAVTITHAVRDREVRGFKEELENLSKQMPNLQVSYYYDEAENPSVNEYKGRINKDVLEKLVEESPDSLFYVCGPVPFMHYIMGRLDDLGIDESRIRHEFFGPAVAPETAN
ncbi:MAG: NO-inducible flavohemoprotein [Bacillus sp. (in: firmicutes)]